MLSIPLSLYSSKDHYVLHYEDYGDYSVKLGYHLAKSVDQPPSSSNIDQLQSWWSKFWSLKLLTKIKHFAWRALNNALPIGMGLH